MVFSFMHIHILHMLSFMHSCISFVSVYPPSTFYHIPILASLPEYITDPLLLSSHLYFSLHLWEKKIYTHVSVHILFYLTCFPVPTILLQTVWFIYSLWLNNTPLCIYHISSLSVLPLMGTYAGSVHWPLWTVLQ